jgi:hypothetical protein
MKKIFIGIPLILIGMLFFSTARAHEGEHEGEKGVQSMHEEGSGESAMEMDRKSRVMSHEYKEEHSGDYSKEHYKNKYGKYEHEKKEMKDEGSIMKEEALKTKEMEQKRMDEGGKI